MGRGHRIHLDGWFATNPVELCLLLRRWGFNVTQTVRRNARNLPADMGDVWNAVGDFELEGEFATSTKHKVALSVNKSRKRVLIMSNYIDTAAEGTVSESLPNLVL